MKRFLLITAIVLASINSASARVLPCLDSIGSACGGEVPTKHQPIIDTKACDNTSCLGPIRQPIVNTISTASFTQKAFVPNADIQMNMVNSVQINSFMNTSGISDVNSLSTQ